MAGRKPLALTLRSSGTGSKGLAPAGELRDRQAERRRALTKATATVLAEGNDEVKHEWTEWKRGAATEGYQELKRSKPLPITLRPSSAVVVTDSQRQRRLAAASRWNKVRLAKAIAAGEVAASSTAVEAVPQVVPDTRHARRGEFECIAGNYRQYDVAELLSLVYKVRDKQLKTCELKKLYVDGAIRVPHKTVEMILYPKHEREAKIAKLEAHGLVKIGAPPQVSALPCPTLGDRLHTTAERRRENREPTLTHS